MPSTPATTTAAATTTTTTTAPSAYASTLPDVRESLGQLLAAVFAHADFDREADAGAGKLFWVFEAVAAASDALDTAHLGDDPDGAIAEALGRATNLARLVGGEVGGDSDGTAVPGGPADAQGEQGEQGQQVRSELYRTTRDHYVTEAKISAVDAFQDVDLGPDIRARAQAVGDSARKALGKA